MKNKENRYKYIIIIIFTMIFAINILSTISDALIDCSNCHTTDPGKSAVKAKDTIVINDSTCFKCHNPNYPPTPIGYNTHLAHVGKYSAKVNFLARHPVVKNLQCSDCHKQIFDCTNCHVVGIPHVPPPLGLNCQGCHNQIDNLFRHPTINLTIHNIFHLNSTKDCQMCHNADSMKSLRLASGDTVPIDQAYNLCKQCHSDIYKLWDNGQHFANKSVPFDVSTAEDPNVKSDFETNWQNQNSCVNCHNPHNPSQLYELPPSTGIPTETATPMYIYALVVVIIAVLIIIVTKYNLKVPIIARLSILGNMNLPKLPKLSLPISLSLEDVVSNESIDKIDNNQGSNIPATNILPDAVKADVSADVKDASIKSSGKIVKADVNADVKDTSIKSSGHHIFDELDKKLEGLVNEVGTSANKKFVKKHRGDILFVSGIVAMFTIFYIVFGTMMPMSVAISESMYPHIEKGDLVFFTNRLDNIQTFDNGKINGYQTFEDYGDVIIYKPLGEEGVTPIIHRAMYYVNKGEPMWMGGPPAPSDGYITKGDNNPDYDQKSSISNLQPVKKEWVVGMARFRVPYIGYIRLLI